MDMNVPVMPMTLCISTFVPSVALLSREMNSEAMSCLKISTSPPSITVVKKVIRSVCQNPFLMRSVFPAPLFCAAKVESVVPKL